MFQRFAKNLPLSIPKLLSTSWIRLGNPGDEKKDPDPSGDLRHLGMRNHEFHSGFMT